MILADSEIRRRLAMRGSGRLIIDPMPDDDCFQAASVDLTLANELAEFYEGNSAIDPAETIEMKNLPLRGGMVLDPGEFILGSTVERVEVPADLVARVEGKSSLGRMGLMVHVTAGFIDPGFRGNITLELRNLNARPIILVPGMKISQIAFEPVFGEVLRPYGSPELGSHYQDSDGVRGYAGAVDAEGQ